MRASNYDSQVLNRGFGSSMLILLSLAGGEKHGYALVKDVESFADTHIAPGTLYEALARLQRQQLIEPVFCNERRRPYRLTAMGRMVLSEHVYSQRRIADIGIRRLRYAWGVA